MRHAVGCYPHRENPPDPMLEEEAGDWAEEPPICMGMPNGLKSEGSCFIIALRTRRSPRPEKAKRPFYSPCLSHALVIPVKGLECKDKTRRQSHCIANGGPISTSNNHLAKVKATNNGPKSVKTTKAGAAYNFPVHVHPHPKQS
jgi:hypothetical protein